MMEGSIQSSQGYIKQILDYGPLNCLHFNKVCPIDFNSTGKLLYCYRISFR